MDIFWSKIKIYLSLRPNKDVQATGEAFSSQKRTSSTSKHEFMYLFFVRHFWPPCSGSGLRIHWLIESAFGSETVN